MLSTEKACSQLPIAEAESLRGEIVNILRKAKPPTPNISKEESRALDKLRKESSIQILPADKGRATVVMESKEEYETKVTDMLKDEKTYEKLNKDPTPRYKKKLVSLLTRLRNEDKLSDQQYKQLYPTSEVVPRMYCTPKIHKQGTPLRPIVDYTGSVGYNTSRYLADILSNVVGKTEHHVRNSSHLAQTLQDITLENDDILNCHDVVSLFTNTPIKSPWR